MKSQVEVRHRRRILCVFPRYAPSFGTFQYAYPMMGGVRAFMPPQGILVIAAYLPAAWELRIVDENIRPTSEEEIAWADAVFVSGMHVQRAEIKVVGRRAQAAGKVTVLGGPSVSASPEKYPEFDYLHLGELGDATDELIRAIDEDARPPATQQRFTTRERLPLTEFPIPAYELIDGRRYFIGSVQFSSGCPYRCEFCDIPALYGRQPRLKTPQQILAELDAQLAAGIKTSIYFVDDNFIGNKKAARELLPHLVAWQKRRGYPVQLCCEATLNIAKSPEILAMMREAYFCTVFCGIESPELAALDAMQKSQNRAVPLLDAVAAINSYGIEVVSGIILGLDTDTPQTADRLIEFIDRSQIPMLTINLLQALPKTPLWDRLEAAGRLDEDGGREFERRLCSPLRRGIAQLAPFDPPRLHPGSDLSPLRLECGAHLHQSDRPAVVPGAPQPGQPAPRLRDHNETAGSGRAIWRLPPQLLANGLARAARRTHRGADPCRDRRASYDRLRARLRRGARERILFYRPAENRSIASSTPAAVAGRHAQPGARRSF